MRGATCFSGIGAPECAMPWVDWLWSAEIEPFPNAVRAVRFPHVPNLGDVLADDFLDRACAYGPLDLLVGGPPCQDFAIGGKRAGLDGHRGNLTLRWVEIIRAIRPVFSLTENVPGWLSVNGGHAFGAFLGALVGHDAALVPPKESGGRWTDAGMVAGPEGRAAWIIKDARHFGVPQRRRRVFVVASAGDGPDPAEVLLKRDGLRRGTTSGREAGESVANGPLCGTPPGGGWGVGVDEAAAGQLIVAALTASGVGTCGADDNQAQAGHLIPVVEAYRLYTANDDVREAPARVGLAATVNAGCGQVGNTGTQVVVQSALAYGGNNTAGPIDVATACNAHGGPHRRLDFQSETFVVQPAEPAFLHVNKGRPAGRKSAHEEMVGVKPLVETLTTDGHARSAVFAPIAFSCKDYGADASGIAPTLRAMTHDGSHANGGGQIAVAFAENSRAELRFMGGDGQTTGALKAGGGKPGQSYPALMQGAEVRRLTVVECERLMGLPDGWTAIPWRGRLAALCPDGPRYRSCGNAIVVNVLRWIGERIATVLGPDADGPMI